MKWQEFVSLLQGIGENTPLAKVVQIRLENDKEVLKNFTSSQHRIRNEWRSRHTVKRSEQDMEFVISELQQAFASMC